MFCSQCGKPIDSDAKFCANCGHPVIKIDQSQMAERTKKNTGAQPQQIYVQAGQSADVMQVSACDAVYDYRSLATEKPTGIRSIHVFDFLIRMTEKENIPVLIYLAINVLIIGEVFTLFFMLPFGWGMLAGLIVYIASVIVALSPIGEFILRVQTGCKKITSVDDVNRLEPLFREVYYKAKKANPTISNDVRLFINEDEAPNAFATGRKTMCVTRGLLNYSDNQIKATMGHEFGHLAHKDTDRILVVSVGNTIISIIFMIVQICIIIANACVTIASIFSRRGLLMFIFSELLTFFSLVVLRGLMKLWTAFGVALCMKTCRGNEYQADEFSFSLGYGSELCTVLASFGDSKAKGLFASLASSHPQSSDRIARLVELGAVYPR
ncbi:MAG: M48 family metalloprotease [Clostridiales bacterium]|nr:M48 family metalloprotease [Clostridiales bacterium]